MGVWLTRSSAGLSRGDGGVGSTLPSAKLDTRLSRAAARDGAADLRHGRLRDAGQRDSLRDWWIPALRDGPAGVQRDEAWDVPPGSHNGGSGKRRAAVLEHVETQDEEGENAAITDRVGLKGAV